MKSTPNFFYSSGEEDGALRLKEGIRQAGRKGKKKEYTKRSSAGYLHSFQKVSEDNLPLVLMCEGRQLLPRTQGMLPWSCPLARFIEKDFSFL